MLVSDANENDEHLSSKLQFVSVNSFLIQT